MIIRDGWKCMILSFLMRVSQILCSTLTYVRIRCHSRGLRRGGEFPGRKGERAVVIAVLRGLFF